MQLFYHPHISENNPQILFTKDESRHITKVLRKTTGDLLQLTNGKGYLFTAKLVSAHFKQCAAQVISKELQAPLPYRLHLAVAPTKMNDRYEWFLEKATEIGVHTITPIICDRSERKVIKPERFEKIVQSATKQSLQCYMPTLNPAQSFKEFIAQSFSGQCYIAHCDDLEKTALKTVLKPCDAVTILIGPEGDFSVKEIKIAIENKFIPVTLGDTRLRTETAAIVACHSVAFANQ